MASALQRLLNGLFYCQRGDYWTEPASLPETCCRKVNK